MSEKVPKTQGVWYGENGKPDVLDIVTIMHALEPGDIVFTANEKSPLTKLIRTFTGAAVPKGTWCPGHVEMVSADWDMDRGTVTWSAGRGGFKPEFLARQLVEGTRVEIWRIPTLNTVQRMSLDKEAMLLSADNGESGYGVTEFVRFGLTFVTTRPGNHELICSEAVCRVYANRGVALLPGDPEKTSPAMVYAALLMGGHARQLAVI